MKKIAIIQGAPKLSRDNFSWHIDAIKSSSADLVLFPELSMNGYKIKDMLLEDAFFIDELELFREYSLKKDICIGVALKENHKVYNASIYFSDGDYTIYRKQHLPNYGLFEEKRFFFEGNEYFCFDTEFGKTSMVICEDVFIGDTISYFSTEKPDLILVLANSPARDFNQNGLLIEDNWNSLLKSLAILSGAYVLFSNRVGFEDGLGFWGGSKVITPKGEIQTTAKLFENDMIEAKFNKKLSLTQKYFLRKE
jgi:predicted amidohydrolase